MKFSSFHSVATFVAALTIIMCICVFPVVLGNVKCTKNQNTRTFKDLCLYDGDGNTSIPIVLDTIECPGQTKDDDTLEFVENGLRYELCVNDSCPCEAKNDGNFHRVQYTFITPKNTTTVIQRGLLMFYATQCITSYVGIDSPPLSSDPWTQTFTLEPEKKYTLSANLKPEVPVTPDLAGIVDSARNLYVAVTFRFMMYNPKHKVIFCIDGKALSKGCPLEDIENKTCRLLEPPKVSTLLKH